MALNVVQKSRRNLTSNKQPVEQEPRKKASKNFPRTNPKANKWPTCNAKQEPHTKKKASKDLSKDLVGTQVNPDIVTVKV